MKTKLLVTIFIVVIALIAGCDSLWHVNDTSDIVFSIDTSDLQRERSVQASQNILYGVNAIDSDVSKITVSIHNASNDSKIASITEMLTEDGKATLAFKNLAIVGKTVYAKAVLESDGEVKEGRSEAKRMVRGTNSLSIAGIGIEVSKIGEIGPGGGYIFAEDNGTYWEVRYFKISTKNLLIYEIPDYMGGGYSDWEMPSINSLMEVYNALIKDNPSPPSSIPRQLCVSTNSSTGVNLSTGLEEATPDKYYDDYWDEYYPRNYWCCVIRDFTL